MILTSLGKVSTAILNVFLAGRKASLLLTARTTLVGSGTPGSTSPVTAERGVEDGGVVAIESVG